MVGRMSGAEAASSVWSRGTQSHQQTEEGGGVSPIPSYDDWDGRRSLHTNHDDPTPQILAAHRPPSLAPSPSGRRAGDLTFTPTPEAKHFTVSDGGRTVTVDRRALFPFFFSTPASGLRIGRTGRRSVPLLVSMFITFPNGFLLSDGL